MIQAWQLFTIHFYEEEVLLFMKDESLGEKDKDRERVGDLAYRLKGDIEGFRSELEVLLLTSSCLTDVSFSGRTSSLSYILISKPLYTLAYHKSRYPHSCFLSPYGL